MVRSRRKKAVEVAGSDISMVGHSDAREANKLWAFPKKLKPSRTGIGPLYSVLTSGAETVVSPAKSIAGA